ncbi:MAG: hypothetical protein ACFFCS_16445 [Candidatus Hodarchaeota archaeon]
MGYSTGSYDANDSRVIQQHGIWLAEADVDYALIDWTNDINYVYNVTENRPDFDMIEKTVPLIFDIWKNITNAPKIAIHLGISGEKEAFTDGRLQGKIDQVYDQFIANPDYRDQYFYYQGKPLIVVYCGTPSPFVDGVPEDIDDRFTFRYSTGFITEQPNLRNWDFSKYGYWSWEDRGEQTYTMIDGKPEHCVITAAYRSQGSLGDDGYIPAGERNNGEYFRASWKRARDLLVSSVLVVVWNEFYTWESDNVENNKDIEPNEEYGYEYFNIMKEEIAKFKE